MIENDVTQCCDQSELCCIINVYALSGPCISDG